MANKAQLIEKVAEKTGLTKKDATTAVDAVFGSIQDFLANGEKVQLIGSKFLQARFQHLSQVRLLRMLLNNLPVNEL